MNLTGINLTPAIFLRPGDVVVIDQTRCTVTERPYRCTDDDGNACVVVPTTQNSFRLSPMKMVETHLVMRTRF